ncbi:cyclopropane-fatty-acyl-phospholipid synthase [Pseudomassariella vexata]|uniref:Cyclopropane-fatty-acyl-phospholipid synthase n=1 Tax=Pseudomassariella vexata TaxID=1141098 RepID=A0A1Y2DKG6_9PEZI|nr:cyclopropane-fatty-acyl-phospholipid synthase [Pseudomassariella vexata]ORY59722.1 cyclopropane-fatty-acyl-phospholipid synthase [Pseudomassariella vexata]
MVPSIPSFVKRPLLYGADFARGSLGSLTWGPALVIAKSAILAVFSSIDVGTLLLVDEPAGTRLVYGQKLRSKTNQLTNGDSTVRRADTIPRVEVVVKNEAFWMRLFLFADMGFAESYMLGEFECADLTAFFQLFIANRDQMSNGTTLFSSISGAITSIARTTNTLSNALLNISAHYDISNDMFAAFLSEDMTYSCPIWKPRTADSEPEETLQEAQMSKLQRFIDGAHIKQSDHVLEIGTGWGSFAIEAVRQRGCRVTSLTLSKEQKILAEERIRKAGFADRIEVKLMDYRNLPIPNSPYDKIVSIEMLEAVGKEFLATYFSHIDRLLKKKGGIAVFQCITMPEGRYEAYSKSEDFINKHIFPGGHLPCVTQLLNHINIESHGTLIVERIENIGGHYAKTLRLWKEAFMANFDYKIRPALKSEHQNMTSEEIEVFRRKWEYYFTYCEAGFLTKTLGDVIITVGREGAMELMEDIPV